MLRGAFFEGMQSYFAPIASIVIFLIILKTDKLFSKYIKNLFLIETIVIAIIIMATWTDRCLSVLDVYEGAWRWRTSTTFLNFALSPLSPMILSMIYNENGHMKLGKGFYIPALINIVICITSVWTGWVFSISNMNVYTRGPLFIVPFAVSALYLLAMLYFTHMQKNMPSRKAESLYLILVMVVTAIASLLEVLYVVRFMIWSTTQATVILYFLVLTTQKVSYDQLTGVFGTTACSRRIAQINGKTDCTIAFLDLNNLKRFNDEFGHRAGNDALTSLVQALQKSANRNVEIYRYAGDEFVLIAKPNYKEQLEEILKRTQELCEPVEGIPVTFAYSIVDYKKEKDLTLVLMEADELMYQHKYAMKGLRF